MAFFIVAFVEQGACHGHHPVKTGISDSTGSRCPGDWIRIAGPSGATASGEIVPEPNCPIHD